MKASITSDILAHGLVASARSFGDDPVIALVMKNGWRARSRAPACVGIGLALGVSDHRIARMLGVGVTTLCRGKKQSVPSFNRAARAAEEAVRRHLEGKAYEVVVTRREAVEAPPEEPELQPNAQAPARASIQRQEPLKTAGKIVQRLPNGVEIVRSAPIPERVLARARTYVLEQGMSVEEFAELFNLEPRSLRHQLEAMR